MNLEQIIDSKHEAEILSFLLLAPPRSFSASELSTRLGIPKNRLEVDLSGMVNGGQVKSFSKKGKKYYLLKQGYKPFPELKNALLKEKLSYTDELFTAIPKIGKLKAAFLSGVFVGQPNLPVDLLLVGSVNDSALQKFLKSVEKMMDQEINYSILSEKEFLIRRDTFDRFIKDIFDYPHLVVFDNIKQKSKKQ